MTLKRRRFLELSAAFSITGLAIGGIVPGQSLDFVSSAHAAVEGLFDELPIEDQTLGQADAPVTIVEYASMTCPHCKHFHETIFPSIKEKYIDTGKVRFVMREFAFDPLAAAAFMLARCAPNDNYFAMIDVLFAQQETWARSSDPARDLLQISKLAGFTEESFRECLTNQKLLDQINAVKVRGEKKFGVDATPTLFINSEKYSGEVSIEDLSKAIDALL